MIPIKNCLENFLESSSAFVNDDDFVDARLLKDIIAVMGGEDVFIESYRNHNGSSKRMTKPKGFEELAICADFFMQHRTAILELLDKLARKASQKSVVALFEEYFNRDFFTTKQITKALSGEFGSDKRDINRIRAIVVYVTIDEVFRLFQHYVADHLYIEYPVL